MIEALNKAIQYLSMREPAGSLETFLAGIGWALVAQQMPVAEHTHPTAEAANILANAAYQFFASPSGEALDNMKEALALWVATSQSGQAAEPQLP